MASSRPIEINISSHLQLLLAGSVGLWTAIIRDIGMRYRLDLGSEIR